MCPKCGYIRKATDTVPAWECPACGVAIAKYSAAHAAKPAPAAEAFVPYEAVPGAPPKLLLPEWTQQKAILAAAFTPVLISLQLFAALLFPMAGAGASWAQDAPMLILCELLLMHAGVLMTGMAGTNGAFRVIGLMFLVPFYLSFIYVFGMISHSWWIAANVGVLLFVRLFAALHDGAQGAGERMARGFLTLALFLIVLAFPILMPKRFPAFGFSPEAFARLKPGLDAYTGLIEKGGDLAKAVLLAALLYLATSAMELVRLRMVYRETSAPGVSVGDASLALRSDGHELTAAHIGNYAAGLLAITMGLVFGSPTYVGLATGQVAEILFGLIFIWWGYKLMRRGLHEILSRTVFHVHKGEIVLRETPLWGDPAVRHIRAGIAAALTVADGYYDKNAAKPEFFKVMLKIGAEDVELASDLETRSQAEGLRKLLLAYVEGVERPEVKQTLHDDADIRNLLGAQVRAFASG